MQPQTPEPEMQSEDTSSVNDRTVAALIQQARSIEHIFEAKFDYDEVQFGNIFIYPDKPRAIAYYKLIDNFQSGLDAKDLYFAGYWVKVSLGEAAIEELATWPSRAMREAYITERKLARLGVDLSQIRSAQVKQYIVEIQGNIEELSRRLEHVKAGEAKAGG